ncbi:MAG: putative zinc-binding metallopeptidase [Polyangiaceae bacterium]
MKIFSCSACKHVAFFENSQCTRCGHLLAYLPDRGVLSALEQEPPTLALNASAWFVALDEAANGSRYRLCHNYATYAVCNWAIPEHDPNEYCPSCRLTETIPALGDSAAVEAWRKLEVAKRRLVYTLIQLGLPLESRAEQPLTGLAFAFMSDGANGERVLTGHCDGLVTINVNEANSPMREQAREQLGERYRTVLGHFRHESGHYYWDRLLKDGAALTEFRRLFGDEQANYDEALQCHYAAPRSNWADEFVSAYATMHPWEDWAETWAHYLHMVDTLETAQSYGLALRPTPLGGAFSEPVAAGGVHFNEFRDLIDAWLPLTVALNSLNRSMGLPDMYPFVLAEPVIGKLRFVHQVVEHASTGARTPLETQPQRAPSNDGDAPGLAQAVSPA